MRIRLLLLALLCWHPAQAAIVVDASTTGTSVSAPPTSPALTFSHTVGASLNNSILVVMAAYYTNPNGSNITGITYNSVALTKIQRNNNGVNAATTEAWYLLNPTAGAHNVVVTISATIGTGDYMIAFARSYSGVDQTNPIDSQSATSQVVTGSHSSHSVSTTTVAKNAWGIDVLTSGSTTAPTVIGSEANALTTTPVINQYYASADLGPIATPGATSMGWNTSTNAVASAMTVISLKAAMGPTHRVAAR